MKFFLDQGLPRSTVDHLGVVNIDAKHVGQLGLSSASDAAILDEARVRSAVVVTLDADFHKLLALSQKSSPSVIRIRIEGLKGDQLALVLKQVISTAKTELIDGAAVSVTPARIRVRLLPIRR